MLDCTAGFHRTAINFQIVGGTSASSPAFAGMLALVINNLENGGATNVRLGQADYTLYPLSKQHSAAFHDVTTGNISVFCLTGATNCGANGFLTGYDAAAGYDLATGLGSVDATQLVQNWSNITFKATHHRTQRKRLDQSRQHPARHAGNCRRHSNRFRRHPDRQRRPGSQQRQQCRGSGAGYAPPRRPS